MRAQSSSSSSSSMTSAVFFLPRDEAGFALEAGLADEAGLDDFDVEAGLARFDGGLDELAPFDAGARYA